MKYLVLTILLASSVSAEELKNSDVVKLQKRAIDILSTISIQGKDAPLMTEALQSIAAVHNDASAKAQKEQVQDMAKALAPEEKKEE